MFNFKNSKKQGDAGMAIAIAYFAMKGYTVSIPLTDSQDYDFVDDGQISRVQVKTAGQTKNNGNFYVDLRVLGGNKSGNGITKFFDNTKVDILFVLTKNHKTYLIPALSVKTKSAITLNKECNKYIVNIFDN